MLEIIEISSNEPIKFLTYGRDFYPGMILKIDESGADIDFCDGYNAFGIAGNTIDINNIEYIEVWHQQGIFRTNMFDLCSEIKEGCELFCHELGILTSNVPYKDAVSIARTTKNASNDLIEFLWL